MTSDERSMRLGAGGATAQDGQEEFDKARDVARQATHIKVFSSFGKKKGRKVRLSRPEEELSMSVLKARDRRQDIGLKRVLAYFAVGAVAIQLGVADWFFHSYLAQVRFKPSDAVMVAWLSSTVVEVIGIVAIIARNLFPNKGSKRPAPDKEPKEPAP